MEDKKLSSICLKFRNGIIGRKDSWGQCYVVSAPLHCFLKFQKIKCELVEGYVTIGGNITNHYWILLDDGRILDPTADQFNTALHKEMPKVYIGERPSWYMLPKQKKK